MSENYYHKLESDPHHSSINIIDNQPQNLQNQNVHQNNTLNLPPQPQNFFFPQNSANYQNSQNSLSYPNPQYYQNFPNPNPNFVPVQPIYQQPYQFQPLVSRALVCLTIVISVTAIYQVLLIIFLSLSANLISAYQTYLVAGLICAVADLFCTILCLYYFRRSKIDKSYCKKGVVIFVISLILFVLTHGLTYQKFTSSITLYKETILILEPIILLSLEVILRILDIYAIIRYYNKRKQFA